MSFFRRDIALGPEDPNVLAGEMFSKINNKIWVVKTLVYISTAFSGAMVLFLTSVFIWRRSLVNRISLRLIFLICASDLIQSIFTIRSFTADTLVKCQVNGFFIDFCVALSVYLSSAIAFNLQMVFLRSSRKPLPKYTEYLYFAVPILASAIHTIPQYAWAIRHDECHPLNPIMPGTKKYLIYIIFVTLLVPTIFVLYNVFTSIRVILTLYFKQRKVSRALNSASFETNRLLKDASDKPTFISKTGSSRGTSLTAEDTRQLQAVRRVYRACIRIALYPLTPILWWIFNATFYSVQYHITMTYQSDVYTMTVLMYINWVAFPSIVILNFLVFLTDPGVLNIVSEVRKLVHHRFGRVEGVSGFTSASQQTTPRASMIKKNGIIITELAESNTSHSDAFSLSSNEGDTPQYSPGRVLEDNGSFTTAIASLGDDNVMRNVRNDSSAQGFYGAI